MLRVRLFLAMTTVLGVLASAHGQEEDYSKFLFKYRWWYRLSSRGVEFLRE